MGWPVGKINSGRVKGGLIISIGDLVTKLWSPYFYGRGLKGPWAQGEIDLAYQILGKGKQSA